MRLTAIGKQFDFFNSVRVQSKFNSIASSFTWNAYFDPNNQDHRQLFKPFQYWPISIDEGSERVLTGTIVSQGFRVGEEKELSALKGYSTTGVLEDCPVPIDAYPLEFNNLNIEQIANQLVQLFGINLNIDSAVQSQVSQSIPQVTVDIKDTPKMILDRVCAQRGLILSHDEFGNLLIVGNRAGQTPITFYDEDAPSTRIALDVNGQRLYSEVTTQKQASLDTDNAAEERQTNSLLRPGVFRPDVKIQTSGTNTDTLTAVRNAFSQQLRNIKIVVTTDRWFWLANRRLQLIRPNNSISVRSENAYLPNRTTVFVESVTLRGTPKEQTAELVCVLPEVYNNTGTIRNPFNF